MMRFKAAAIQLTSRDDVEDNLRRVSALVASAAKDGASLVVLPENVAYMGRSPESVLDIAEQAHVGPIQQYMCGLAKRHGVWLVAGTLPVLAGERKIYARSLLIDPNGQVVSYYDKMHLFDVTIAETAENYCESTTVQAGQEVVVATTQLGHIGLSVCYDIRFPNLFQAMWQKQVQILTVPAAFTQVTGQAHWEVLLRARAIENQCYVIAAGQTGRHVNGRQTYGHSMIIDPWGVVLACLPVDEGIVSATIDLQQQAVIRAHMPLKRAV